MTVISKSDTYSRKKRIRGIPITPDKSLRHMKNPEGLSVEQIMAGAVLDIKKITPYLFAALCVVPRIESEEVNDIEVSPGKIYYNPRFIILHTREEITFYLMHALYHILMKHHLRGRGKEPSRWNKACDLYINRCITDSFGVTPGDVNVSVIGPSGQEAFMSMPEREVYDVDIDVRTDTPETIYRRLFSQEKKREDSEKEQGDSDGGEDESRQGQSSPSPEKDRMEPNLTDHRKSMQMVLCDRRDMLDDQESWGESEIALGQEADRLMTRIDSTAGQMNEAIFGRGLNGDDAGFELVKKEDVPLADWRTILRNKLIDVQIDEKSLSHPDRRFVHTGLYVEGPDNADEKLADLKICIDTSASMTDRDLEIAMKQTEQMVAQFNTNAELVFWDEIIEDTIPFDSVRDLKLARNKAKGRGGTNPNCLFDTFYRKERQTYTQVRPSLTIVFTDGYFELPDQTYSQVFGKDVIWVLCAEDAVSEDIFDPGFGKVARLVRPEKKR